MTEHTRFAKLASTPKFFRQNFSFSDCLTGQGCFVSEIFISGSFASTRWIDSSSRNSKCFHVVVVKGITWFIPFSLNWHSPTCNTGLSSHLRMGNSFGVNYKPYSVLNLKRKVGNPRSLVWFVRLFSYSGQNLAIGKNNVLEFQRTITLTSISTVIIFGGCSHPRGIDFWKSDMVEIHFSQPL